MDYISITHMQLCALDTIYYSAIHKLDRKRPDALQSMLQTVILVILQILLNCTIPVFIFYTF